MEYLVVFLVLVVFLQTRVTDLKRAVICLASQSLIIAVACFALGFSTSTGLHAIMPGLLTLVVKVIFIPGAILRLVGKLKNEREILSESNVNYSTMAAALFLVMGYAIIQMAGLITLENGIYLLGLLMTDGLPLVVELGVFLDVLIAVVVLVILTSRMRLSFMTTDTSVMKKLKG